MLSPFGRALPKAVSSLSRTMSSAVTNTGPSFKDTKDYQTQVRELFRTEPGENPICYLHGMGPINYTLLALFHAAGLDVVAGTTHCRSEIERHGVKVTFVDDKKNITDEVSVPPSSIPVVSSREEYRSLFGHETPHLITVGTQQHKDVDKVLSFTGDNTQLLVTAQNGLKPWQPFADRSSLFPSSMALGHFSLFIQNSIPDEVNQPTSVVVNRWVDLKCCPIWPQLGSDLSDKMERLMTFMTQYGKWPVSSLGDGPLAQREKTMNNVMNVMPALFTKQRIQYAIESGNDPREVQPATYGELTEAGHSEALKKSLDAVREYYKIFRNELPNDEAFYVQKAFSYVDGSSHPPTTSTIASKVDEKGHPLREMEQLFSDVLSEGSLRGVQTPNLKYLADIIDRHNRIVRSSSSN